MARRESHRASDSKDGRYEHSIPSREEILQVLERAEGPLALKDLGESAGLRGEPKLRSLEHRLKAMVRDGQLLRNRAREYCLTGHLDLVTGKVQAHRDGFGFLRRDDAGEDVYLSAREMRPVWDGDRVAVRVSPGQRGLEGHLVEILARAKARIVGQLRREGGIPYVLEEGDSRTEVLIARGELGGAKSGEMVEVEILEYPTQKSHAIGRVVKKIGRVSEPGVETDVAILAHGIPNEWPETVLASMRDIPSTVPEVDKQGREDLRELPLVTIDGADAKDFDDAVYCEPQGDGWRLLVAIADVSHYVEVGSALDSEARLRGTSVYFPDRVVPMLPEALSNGLCSLNPKVDRLCMVCEMLVARDGKVRRSRFFAGLMRSAARLTYTEAAAVLDGNRRAKHAELRSELGHLRDVYRAFAKARKRRGAIDFDLPQTKIELNPRGRIEAIHPLRRLVTHRIIEECMIAANVEAAKRIRSSRLPSLYRVHEGPDADRLDELALVFKTFGLKLPPAGKLAPLHLSRLLDKLHGKAEAELVETMLLRSMGKAHYQPKNVGHFGLALGAYAHFTSPIRRYPDLLVHRAIRWSLTQRSSKGFAFKLPQMQELGERCSDAERRADEAVWDVEEQFKCHYMSERVGERFDAIVSGVVPFGLFVRLPELTVDGLVHVSALPRDYYHRDPSGTTLSGERTGTSYRLSDKMAVRLAAVNLEERKIDFVPEESPGADPSRRRGRRRG